MSSVKIQFWTLILCQKFLIETYLNYVNNFHSFQAEDMTLNMNMNRRKQALKSYLFYIQSALERERKGKEGEWLFFYLFF